ncbi:hypothetical protein BG004_004478 [Podila humilis]|nr:hypothetical protein BG004_004478 [Podila humilis]
MPYPKRRKKPDTRVRPYRCMDSFFASLAGVASTISQEQQGIRPSILDSGPEIKVSSFNKRQRPAHTQFRVLPEPAAVDHASSSNVVAPDSEKDDREEVEEMDMDEIIKSQSDSARGGSKSGAQTDTDGDMKTKQSQTSEEQIEPEESMAQPENAGKDEFPHKALAVEGKEAQLSVDQRPTHDFGQEKETPFDVEDATIAEAPSIEMLEPTSISSSTPSRQSKHKIEEDSNKESRKKHMVAFDSPVAAPTTTATSDNQKSTIVIDLDSDNESDSVSTNVRAVTMAPTEHSTAVVKVIKSAPKRTMPTMATNKKGHTNASSSTFSANASTSTNNNNSTSTTSTPVAAKPSSSVGPLSSVSIYLIPAHVDSGVIVLSHKRVMDLQGKWLGPKTKILTPRGRGRLPPLDQEKTTHIVTALSTFEAVKKALNVESINPRIEIVKKEWLADSIQFKKPMDPELYRIGVSSSTGVPSSTTKGESPQSPVDSPPRIMEKPVAVVDILPPSNIGTSTAGNASNQLKNKSISEQKAATDSAGFNFREIVQGLQEGSLDDDDISDVQDSEQEEQEEDNNQDQHPYKKRTAEAPASTTAAAPIPLMSSSPKGPSTNNAATELTEEEKEQLRAENKCFYCREVGHWASKCQRKKLEERREDKDQVLLQIINSGKAIAHMNSPKKPKIQYRCQSAHIAGVKEEQPFNKAILEQLTTMMNYYDKVKTAHSKEHFKVINYRKAITSIRALDYEITSEEMALKVPRVGKKIAEKIGEIVSYGQIKKLSHLDWDKERSSIETLFRSVYGVGSENATEWYNKGLRTLDDLRRLPDLTQNQKSGLKYYHDLLVRIPRSEVEQIGRRVEKSAHAFHADIQSQVTGSYRRGKQDCGDVDIVVARPNIDRGEELYQIMEHILHDLKSDGFLVDDLSVPVYHEDYADKMKHFKYMGICRLPGPNAVHHHIDILVVPWTHLGAVLIYFTGNDICNRSMRLLASNRGMRLSDKGLFKNVLRGPKRQRLNEGEWVAGRTEKEIFDYLGIKYLEPHEREC